MAFGTPTTRPSISDPTGYCFSVVLRYGSNGDDQTVPEMLVTGRSGSQANASAEWFPDDPSNGSYDSGNLRATVTVPAAGGPANPVKLNVAGELQGALGYGGSTYGTVTSVIFDAVVRVGAVAQWQSLILTYTQGGTSKVNDVLSAPLTANTIGQTVVTQQSIVTSTPGATTYDGFRVNGTIHMQYPVGVVPGPNDLELRVYAYTSSCNG